MKVKVMKTIIILALGAAIGIFAMQYHTDKSFAKETNKQLGNAASSVSTAVHGALQSSGK